MPINTRLLTHLLKPTRSTPHRLYHSVLDLSNLLGLSIQQTQQAISQLVQAGCQIQTHAQHGIELIETGVSCWQDYLQHEIGQASNTPTAPWPVQVYAQLGSTQDAAKRMIESLGPPAHGGVVVANEQTDGRGRLGNRWTSPGQHGITFSLAWLNKRADPTAGRNQTKPSAQTIDHFMLASAVAIAQALEQVTLPQPLEVVIKWPNDILVDGRKLAGILIERFVPSNMPDDIASVIGVGINVSLLPEHLPPNGTQAIGPWTSLALCGKSVDRLSVLAEAIGHLRDKLAMGQTDALVAHWQARHTQQNQWVTLLNNGQSLRCQIIDIDPDAGLVVRNQAGVIRHFSCATTCIEHQGVDRMANS